jgi:TM2 domain-containing membrane protein YozV
MGLSVQEQMLIEQRVTNEAKSVGAAYLLWFFLGYFGAHRFYLGRTGSGAAQLILLVLVCVTAFIVVGAVLLVALGIWWIVDAFLIPGIIDEQKGMVRQRLTDEAVYMNRQTEEPKRTVIPGHV